MQLVVTREGATLILDNDPANGPKDNQWLLPNGHSNFNALYSLALAAAANRWILVIRIAGDAEIDINRQAEVARMGVSLDKITSLLPVAVLVAWRYPPSEHSAWMSRVMAARRPALEL